jgi:hypothetical protein
MKIKNQKYKWNMHNLWATIKKPNTITLILKLDKDMINIYTDQLSWWT